MLLPIVSDGTTLATEYVRPDPREVWEEASRIDSREGRKRYLHRVLQFDQWGGLLRRPQDDEWFEFTPNSVRIQVGGGIDTDAQAEFEREGGWFQRRVREMITFVETQGEAEPAPRSPEEAVGSESEDKEAESGTEKGLDRLPWSESQNMLGAWVHLTYNAFIRPAEEGVTEKRFIREMIGMFKIKSVGSEEWGPPSFEPIYKNKAKDGALDRVVKAMRAAKDRLEGAASQS